MANELLLSSVFVAGFLSFFSPCTFSLMPAYVGIITDKNGEYKNISLGNLSINIGAILKTFTFILGVSTTFIILGFGAGLFGRFINSRILMFIGGLIVFFLGLHQMDIINIKTMDKMKGLNIENTKTKALGTYIMGLSFSLGWTPCIGPILAAVILTSASSGQEFYGAFMMAVYSLGLMVPFLIMAVLSSAMMENLGVIKRNLTKIKRAGGFLVMIMGIILMTDNLPQLNAFFNNILR